LPPAGTYKIVVKAGAASSTFVVTLSNIVAKVSLLNQAASIPLTTLWTPASNGVFRVSIYMVQPPPFPGGTCCGTGNVGLEFQWTDDAGTQSQISGIQYSDASLTLYQDGCLGTSLCPEMEVQGGIGSPGSPGAVFILQVQGGTPIHDSLSIDANRTRLLRLVRDRRTDLMRSVDTMASIDARSTA
jgi:hypothetical protein